MVWSIITVTIVMVASGYYRESSRLLCSGSLYIAIAFNCKSLPGVDVSVYESNELVHFFSSLSRSIRLLLVWQNFTSNSVHQIKSDLEWLIFVDKWEKIKKYSRFKCCGKFFLQEHGRFFFFSSQWKWG